MSKLLIDDHPLQVSPKLAVRLGLNEAMLLQQIHYLITNLDNQKIIRVSLGQRWIKKSYKNWREDYFPFFSEVTIKRALISLEKAGYIVSAILDHGKDGLERTKWYTVDYGNVEALAAELDAIPAAAENDSSMDTRMDQFDPFDTNLIHSDSQQSDGLGGSKASPMDQIDPILIDSSDSDLESSKPQQQLAPAKQKPVAVVVEDHPEFPDDPKRDRENRVIDLYREAFTASKSLGMLPAKMLNILRKDAAIYPLEWFEQAIEITLRAGKDYRYAKAILDNWQQGGGPGNDKKPYLNGHSNPVPQQAGGLKRDEAKVKLALEFVPPNEMKTRGNNGSTSSKSTD